MTLRRGSRWKRCRCTAHAARTARSRGQNMIHKCNWERTLKYYTNAMGEQHYAHGSGGTEYGGIARVGEAGGGGGGGADEEERALGSRLVMQ